MVHAPSIVDNDEERLALLDHVGRELGGRVLADVLHRVDRLGRDHQRIAGTVRLGAHAVDRVLQLAFQDVDDLFTGMPVPKWRGFRAQLDSVLDDDAAGDPEVVLLQIGPLDSGAC
jgi:hypothetical protein